MARHRRYARSSFRGNDFGRERALQHIREAQELSAKLGGTDKDVKAYFFSLSPRKLQEIFDAYEKRYGSDKRSYAEATFENWRTGRRQMSALVASRLFDLLPELMPLNKKYELVAALWSRLGPSSRKTITVHPETPLKQVANTIAKHVEHIVNAYTIPEPLQQRFKWLCHGDVRAQQQLLNHFRELEKQQAVELSKQQAAAILEHFKMHGDITGKALQKFNIGRHCFEISYGDTRPSSIREGVLIKMNKGFLILPAVACIAVIAVILYGVFLFHAQIKLILYVSRFP